MSVNATSAAGQQTTAAPPGGDAFGNVKLEDFIKLLVAELSNQDPLEPMDNSQIVEQVSQIQQIESNQRLTETLESVMLGQSIATAGNLLGRTVVGLTDQQAMVTGEVDRVSIAEGKVKLHLGEHTVGLTNVSEIVQENVAVE